MTVMIVDDCYDCWVLSAASVACTFETGLCGWTQDHSDDFDWTSHTGTTATSGTGPNNDHTLRTRAGTCVRG